MHNGGSYGPGDLGRRVAARRRGLDLTRAQLAATSGMAASYLAYLEEHPANVGNGGLMRLADALATTPAALLGCEGAQSRDGGAVGV